jgi:AcrR family transcriptional regulator
MSPQRTTSRGEKKRHQLRRAAVRCFSANGYHDTTVDAIVEAADTSKGSFYWHYESKLAVLVDILGVWGREVMEALFERFQPAVATDGSLLSRIDSIAVAIVAEIDRGRAMLPLWLEFTALAPREPQVAEELARFYVRGRSAIVEVLDPVFDGRFDAATRRGIAAALFAFYMGLLMQELPDPERGSAPKSVQRLIAAIYEGVSSVRAGSETPVSAGDVPVALLRRAGGLLRGHVVALRALVRDALPDAIEVLTPAGAIVFELGRELARLDVRDGRVVLAFDVRLGDDVDAPGLVRSADGFARLEFGPTDPMVPVAVRDLMLVAFARGR